MVGEKIFKNSKLKDAKINSTFLEASRTRLNSILEE
jgi:hypothetical protein